MLRQKSFGSVRLIWIDRDELLASLRSTAARIRLERPEVKEVRLFGSLARNDQSGESDADLLIVVRGAAQADPLDCIRQYYRFFSLPVSVDLLVYDQEQLDLEVQSGNAFLGKILSESVLLA